MLTTEQALARLVAGDHAVLCTVHHRRGADAVPVVYAVVDGHLGIPIDEVKAKSSSRLQRERNLEADPRATLLVEQWDRDDWSKLWWVRVELRWLGARHQERAAPLADALAHRYPQYRDRPFSRILVFRIVAVAGWSAGS